MAQCRLAVLTHQMAARPRCQARRARASLPRLGTPRTKDSNTAPSVPYRLARHVTRDHQADTTTTRCIFSFFVRRLPMISNKLVSVLHKLSILNNLEHEHLLLLNAIYVGPNSADAVCECGRHITSDMDGTHGTIPCGRDWVGGGGLSKRRLLVNHEMARAGMYI